MSQTDIGKESYYNRNENDLNCIFKQANVLVANRRTRG